MAEKLLLSITGSASGELKSVVQAALLRLEGLFEEATAASTEAAIANAHPFVLCLDEADTAAVKPVHQRYHYRYIWTEQSDVAELVAVLRPLVDSLRRSLARPDRSTGGLFTSTRGSTEEANFISVVRDGLAGDGGLFILKNIPVMPYSQLCIFCKQRRLAYVEAAECILEQLVDASISPAVLYPLVLQAYDRSRWSDREDICPLVPLLPDLETPPKEKQKPDGNGASGDTDRAPSFSFNARERWAAQISLMELYHGPTAAFKDFALQLFPLYFNTATAAQAKGKYVILAATSGDTGVAAISGFVNAGGHSQVMVLYPKHGVSPVQQTQMLSYDDGARVRAYAVDSDFDFCQRTVKSLFSNKALNAKLEAVQPTAVRLSSANSINWGRLIPQVVYYFWAYRHHVQHPPRGWAFGDPVDFVVPCGNFGNVLSGYIAKLMGLPVRRFVVASNQNDVLHDFVKTGVYDVRHRTLAATSSPSIDILKASNVERFLYLLSGGDTALVARLMHELDTDGVFILTEEMREAMQATFAAGRCTEEDCANTIKSIFELSHGARLLDPHTAVAVFVAQQFREEELLKLDLSEPTAADGDGTLPPLVIASTAHWAKFPSPVLHAMQGDGALLGNPAPSVAAAIGEVRAFYENILEKSPKQEVHVALSKALDVAEQRANGVREVLADVTAIQKELEEFALQ